MVIVVRDREIVHANTLDGSIFFLLELFLLEDVISGNLVRLRIALSFLHICIHVGNVLVHVDDLVVVATTRRRSVLLSRGVDVVHVLHHVVYVNDLAGFALFRRPRLEPSILQFNFLDGTRS